MTAWLLTWLWQGSALAAGVAVALRCAPRRNAATRHFIWCAALVAVAWLGWAGPQSPAPASAPSSVGSPIYIPSAPGVLITTFSGIWAAIALVSLLRVLSGLRGVYAARDRCRPFPSGMESSLPLWLEAKECGRRASLMICNDVPGATVLGFNRPCIALPSSLVEALAFDELDQVILHEYAHVQRRDDWARLAQTLLLSVLWVHPAALFVSRALNREREMACDEWVVARTGSPKAYARCLAHAAEARARMGGGPTLVPALIGSCNELLRRVDRVLAIKGTARRSVSIGAAAVAALAIMTVTVQLQGVRRLAEIAQIVFPIDQVQRVQLVQRVQRVRQVQWVQEVRRPLPAQPAPQILEHVRNATLELYASSAPIAPVAPLAPAEPASPHIAPSAHGLSARVFPGAYYLPDAPPDASEQSNRWQAIAAPGVEIASSVKKTSMGLANAFSRAGVSLARSF